MAVLDARPFDGQGYPDSFAQLLDHLDVVANDQSIIGASGLLDGWQPHHVQWLLIAALDERSLPGVKFAAAQGAVRSLDDATLQGMLTGVTGWCASRGLRFRLREFLMGKGAAHIVALRNGLNLEELIKDLLRAMPQLKHRGAALLHSTLRIFLQLDHNSGGLGSDDSRVSEHEVASGFLDDVTAAMCLPFLRELAEAAGPREALDASHIAANFASMAAGPSVLSVLLRAHYRIEPQGPDGLSRCLSCPQCCLDNGVSPIGDPRMQFSAQHAAAASGRLDVLEWLEARLPPQPSARQMLFRADDAAAEAGAPAAPPASTRVSADTGGWPSDPPQAEGVVEGSCDIYTVSGEAVMRSPRAFFDRFVRGALPVVVRGLVRADKALSPAVDALSRRFLLERLGRTVWEVGDIPYEGRYTASAPEPMTLETYVEQVIDGCNATAPCPRYVFAERFERDGRVVAVKSERLMAMPTWARCPRCAPRKARNSSSAASTLERQCTTTSRRTMCLCMVGNDGFLRHPRTAAFPPCQRTIGLQGPCHSCVVQTGACTSVCSMLETYSCCPTSGGT